MLKRRLDFACRSSWRHSSWLSRYEFRCFSGSSSTWRDEQSPVAIRHSVDIKSIRSNPSLYSQNCHERNYNELAEYPYRIAEAHSQWLELERNGLEARLDLKAIEAQLSSKDEGRKGELREKARKCKETLSDSEKAQVDLKEEIYRLSGALPNLTSNKSPRGHEPYILDLYEPPSTHYKEPRRDHVRIGTALGLLDFGAAATTSGWGFYFLLNEAEKLEHALVQYARSVAQQHGFHPVSAPSIIYSDIGTACGFRPRDQNGEQQVYGIQQSERDVEKGRPSHSLAGTAEIPFAAIWANKIMDNVTMPHRVMGSSRCYRAEAGARGRETRGLYRVHEFTKVEMFVWTLPGEEAPVFDEIVAIQKQIIRSLGLPFRRLEMPAHDLGANAYRKQDIEVFFPSRKELNGGWGEVTSASICTDYQTRRLNTRIKTPPGSETKLAFPSTVNGTAMAVPRMLAAILENGWAGEETVEIPEALWPWMDGQKVIGKTK
ncbi:MAG: hypothetical protein Q9217_000725 [Psora testacea]